MSKIKQGYFRQFDLGEVHCVRCSKVEPGGYRTRKKNNSAQGTSHREEWKLMAIEYIEEKFAELTKALTGVKNVYLLCHDNPDPDSLASMMALRYLLSKRFNIRSRMLYAGEIGRAENRAMVRLLKIHLTPLDKVRWRKSSWFALVDTQCPARNHSLPEGARVLMVFDHHPVKRPQNCVFSNIREELGATSTLMINYLQHAELEIDWRLATALAYALISETQDLGREARREDVQAYLSVLPKARLRLLSQIKYPLLAHDYYRTLSRGLKKTYLYKNTIVTRLGHIDSPDMVHQMADLLLRFERRSWSLTVGWNEEWIFLSLRSSNLRAKCGKLIQKMVRGKGHAGGHDMVAGGRINCSTMDEKEKEAVEELVIGRFMRLVAHTKDLGLFTPLIEDEPGPVKPERPVWNDNGG
jgi:nanoRNase/pAp phosphatase (c-di-AMP/oligoRNAs hydrolase)